MKLKCKVGDIVQLSELIIKSFKIGKFYKVESLLRGAKYDFRIYIDDSTKLPLSFSEIDAVFTKETHPEFFL